MAGLGKFDAEDDENEYLDSRKENVRLGIGGKFIHTFQKFNQKILGLIAFMFIYCRSLLFDLCRIQRQVQSSFIKDNDLICVRLARYFLWVSSSFIWQSFNF